MHTPLCSPPRVVLQRSKIPVVLIEELVLLVSTQCRDQRVPSGVIEYVRRFKIEMQRESRPLFPQFYDELRPILGSAYGNHLHREFFSAPRTSDGPVVMCLEEGYEAGLIVHFPNTKPISGLVPPLTDVDIDI